MNSLAANEDVQNYFATTDLRFQGGFRNPVEAGYCCLHHHPFFEIVLHTDCSGVTTLATGQRLPFQSGSVVINPPFLKHDQRSYQTGIDTCILIESTCALPPLLQQMIYIPCPQAPWIFSDITVLLSAAKPARNLDAQVLSHRAAALFLQLLQYSEVASDDSPLSATTALVAEADRLLRSEYATLRTVSEVADRLSVSTDHLRHSYRRLQGIGMKQQLMRLRIERACVLLTTSTLPIKSIAAQCGFTEDRSFSTYFKSLMACTANDYRQKHRLTSLLS